MLRVLSTEYSKQKNLIWLTYFKNLAEKIVCIQDLVAISHHWY